MEISRNDSGKLTSTITIKVDENDYKEKVDESLRSYRKKATMPGFRQGKVPASVIKKMYGKAALIDEVYKIISEKVYNYVDENKIEIFGNPLLDSEKARENNWDTDQTFSFDFEIALIPEITPELSKDIKLVKYQIEQTEEDTNRYIDEIKTRYGKYEQVDTVSENCFVYAELKENKEDGLQKTFSFMANNISEGVKKLVIDKKKDETVEFNSTKLFKNESDFSEFARLKPEELETIGKDFSMKFLSIMNIIPAVLNEELFEKVYPNKSIKTEAELLEAVNEDIKLTHQNESKNQFLLDIQEEMKKRYPFDVPEDFLKRWMKQNSEKEISDEEINKGFDSYSEHLKWQVIENKLIKKYEIKNDKDDFRNEVKRIVGMGDVDESTNEEAKAQIDSIIQTVLQREEDARRIYDEIFDRKVAALFEEQCTISEKKIKWEDFIKLAQK